VPDRSQASWPLGGAEVAGSGPVPSSLGQASCRSRGQAPCARSLPGIVASGRRRGRRVRPRAQLAGSGTVPSSLGQASCRSLGQAPCCARWVRLRAEPLRRAGRSAGHDRCILTWLSVFCSVLSRSRVFCLGFAPRLNFA
jgi:hypothetical protein